jgi:drug/metabolite transporter (DMT)-like permease
MAISACVGGVALFVTVAALVGGEKPVSDIDLITILVMLGVVLLVFALGFVFFRRRSKAIFFILAAGIIYGFVATLAKVVINRIVNENFDWLTILCVIALLAATGIGAYFVQTAYSSGPPDLVIAGLTVVDPMVAVAIGIVVLDEASGAPLWAVIGFAIAGAIAAWGVFQLARHHPQVQP